MSEEQKAQALEQWLEQHPGQAPPQEVDSEVLEAIYALRPDLAPAPKLSVDDILDGVNAGPFATDDQTITAPHRIRNNPDEDSTESSVISFQMIQEEAAEKKKRPWYLTPAVGLVAAAALVMIIVIPTTATMSDAPIGVTAESKPTPAKAPVGSPPPPAPLNDASVKRTPPDHAQVDHPMVVEALEQLEGAGESEAPQPKAKRAEAVEQQVAKNDVAGFGQVGGSIDSFDDGLITGREATPSRDERMDADVDTDPGDLDKLASETGVSRRSAAGGAGSRSQAEAPTAEPVVQETVDFEAEEERTKNRSRRKKSKQETAASEASGPAGLEDLVEEKEQRPAPATTIAVPAEPEPDPVPRATWTDAQLQLTLDEGDPVQALRAALILGERQLAREAHPKALQTVEDALAIEEGDAALRVELTGLQRRIASAMTPPADSPVLRQSKPASALEADEQ